MCGKQFLAYTLTATVLIMEMVIVPTELKWIGIEKPCLCQEFRCANGTACLHKSRVCNGVKDCIDGEDELGYADKSCFKRVVKCKPETEFKCKFGGCINITQVCDGIIDCFGGVDEATDFCSWVHGDSNSTEFNGH